MDIAKIMPTNWDFPAGLSQVTLYSHESPTINFCDQMVNKANILYESFRGKSEPKYVTMKKTKEISANQLLPSISKKSETNGKPIQTYDDII